MRLEQKPENPSPLSVRQLMRELKEGIRVATKYRQRVLGYIEAVFNDLEIGVAMKLRMKNFEDSLLQVFELYLEYVEQWSLLEHDTFQKCLLEDEWNFSCEIVQFVVGGSEVVGKKFCRILKLMLESIGERLLGRIEECASALQVKQDDTNRKYVNFILPNSSLHLLYFVSDNVYLPSAENCNNCSMKKEIDASKPCLSQKICLKQLIYQQSSYTN